jgi:Na+-transporting NADH:ubiquinone oxidoreductase subunit NqrE
MFRFRRGRTRRRQLAIFLSVLSVACAIGAAVSFLRYDSKDFDLLVLSGGTFLSAAIPSFEGDASLEELKSIIA